MGSIKKFKNRENKEIGEYLEHTKYIQENNIIYRDLINLANQKNLNLLSVLENIKFNELEGKIYSCIENEKYLENIIFRLDLIRDFADYKWTDTGVIGYIDDYFIKISLRKDGISFKSGNGHCLSKGNIKYMNSHYLINYYDKTKSALLNFNRSKSNYISKTCQITSKLYDYNDFEQYSKIVKSNCNYEYDSETKEKKYIPTDTLENTIEIKKYFRRKSKILHEHYLKYLNKERYYKDGVFHFDEKLDNKEDYYVGDNYMSNKKELPTLTYFKKVNYSDYKKLIKKR